MADADAPGAAPDDELRPVTLLFADVVGSTALGERLPPEEVKSLIGECVTRMSRAVEEFGGRVQSYQGDGICAYFGVPTAHEDDPERAARAALRILQLVGEDARDIEAAWGIGDFGVRVGVNSGQTAVGRVGSATPQTVALGDAGNVAARLQAAADPGTVVVGEATARRLTRRFVLEWLGDLKVKNRRQAVSAYRLVRPTTAPRPAARAPLVGRDEQLRALSASLDDLRAGRGRIVLVLGEAGLGKTRLVGELHALAERGPTWLEGRCPSYGGVAPYAPFVEMLRGWLGTAEGDAEIGVRTRLRARLSALMGERAAAILPGLAALLSVRSEPAVEQPAAAGPALRAAYVGWLEALLQQGPLVVALEDLHAADAATCELAEELLPLTDRGPLMVVATSRADPGTDGWRVRVAALSGFMHRTTELTLEPLAPEAASRLVDLLAESALEQGSREDVVARAEGNPLYLEELVHALAEGQAQDRQRTWTISLRSAELPTALEGLLVARIDRLPDEGRQAAQTAAAIGRVFAVDLLALACPELDVPEALGGLLRAGIVRELRRYPEFECTFRHGLLQEAALATLTPERRTRLYGRVARAAEQLYAERLDDHLEQLAYYYALSDSRDRAAAYLEAAGARARALGDDEAAGRLARRLAGLTSTDRAT